MLWEARLVGTGRAGEAVEVKIRVCCYYVPFVRVWRMNSKREAGAENEVKGREKAVNSESLSQKMEVWRELERRRKTNQGMQD